MHTIIYETTYNLPVWCLGKWGEGKCKCDYANLKKKMKREWVEKRWLGHGIILDLDRDMGVRQVRVGLREEVDILLIRFCSRLACCHCMPFSALVSLVSPPSRLHPTFPAISNTLAPCFSAKRARVEDGLDKYEPIACEKALFRVTCHVIGGFPIPNAPDVLVKFL